MRVQNAQLEHETDMFKSKVLWFIFSISIKMNECYYYAYVLLMLLVILSTFFTSSAHF